MSSWGALRDNLGSVATLKAWLPSEAAFEPACPAVPPCSNAPPCTMVPPWIANAAATMPAFDTLHWALFCAAAYLLLRQSGWQPFGPVPVRLSFGAPGGHAVLRPAPTTGRGSTHADADPKAPTLRARAQLQHTQLQRLVHAQCPTLFAGFSSTPWLPNGHLQTLWASRPDSWKSGSLLYDRDLLQHAEGGHNALDWFPCRPGGTVPARSAADADQAASDPVPPGPDPLPRTAPVIIILHGLTGGSHEAYVQDMVRAVMAVDHGVRVVVMNARGCAGSQLTSAQLYNACYTGDLRATIGRVQEATGALDVPMAAVGFSLGANVLTCYLGETGERSPLLGAVAISNPFDLLAGARWLDSSVAGRHIYSPGMGRSLGRLFSKHAHHFTRSPATLTAGHSPSSSSLSSLPSSSSTADDNAGTGAKSRRPAASSGDGSGDASSSCSSTVAAEALDATAQAADTSADALAGAEHRGTLLKTLYVSQIRSPRTFDHHVTRLLGRYASVDDYYRRGSSAQYVPYIRVPYLAISAEDDPVVPWVTWPVSDAAENPYVVLAAMQRGGHVGWYEGWRPRQWVQRPAAEFLVMALRHAQHGPDLSVDA